MPVETQIRFGRRALLPGFVAAAVGANQSGAQAEPDHVFDSHFHIIDPRFPLVASQGYRPPPFRLAGYIAAVRPLGVTAGAVVSGSFQGSDQGYLRSVLADLGPGLTRMAAPLSIDHLGMTQAGLPALLDLVSGGVKVKAAGFGRVKMDLPHALESIAARDPDPLMFGSAVPSTRAERPFQVADVDLLCNVLRPALVRRALWDNAQEFYR